MFLVGDLVHHRLRNDVGMLVCSIGKKDDDVYFTVQCRWYEEKLTQFKLEWFMEEELEK